MGSRLTNTATERLKATLADSYTIERELGRGGMATVYLAQDLKHERPVALKVLHRELASSLGPERFLREIRLAARLQHPHILTVLDSGEALGLLWYTMPYVEGESLRDRLQREQQLPLADALRITTEAALALDYAHRHGVVHRDIKPENILLSDGQALVADFGVARALEQGSEGKLTETGLAVGTPAYMSPEQASGGPVDGRSDIYALGCVLYEILAGEPPYTGPTPQAIIAKRFADPVPSIRRVRERIPEAVDQALRQALAKAPGDRFPTAAQLARALGDPTIMHSVAVTPSAESPPALAGAKPLISRRTVSLSVAVLLGLGAAASALFFRPRPTPRTLDGDLLAVAPFDVLDPGLALWREGMVDLLARNLDGAGPLRTVSPTVAVRRWHGRADRASATALARSVGAGVAIYGTLVGAGPDSVRLSANVLDVGRDQVVGEVELRGPATRMDLLADSLTVRALSELAQARPIGAARSSGIGSRSLPALRSFLHGEQFFRRAEWDSARVRYERAIALDSGFALAYWRLATTRGWQFSLGDSLALVFRLRAGELNRGLPPRESLLIGCDALMGTIEQMTLPDTGARGKLRRLFRATERVRVLYPSDPEAWVALGEARYHYGAGLGVSDEMMLAPFERAITLDSSYAPAYIHAVEMALRLKDEGKARRYLARYLALRPGGNSARVAQATSRILDTAVSAAEIDRLLDTLPTATLQELWFQLQLAPDSAEIAIDIARRVAERRITEDMLFGGDPAIRHGLLAATLAFRGHLRESARIVMAHREIAEWALFTELALAGAIPADTADAFYRRRLNREAFWSVSHPFQQEGLHWAPSWWAARGDSASLKRFLERSNWRTKSKAPPGAVTNPYWKARGEAYLALARGDTSAALSRLSALPDSTGGLVWLERLTLARLLVASGRDREALRVLDTELPHPVVTGTHGVWALERARLAEKSGENEKAKYWYGYIVALWRHADPELQPYVTEAREALRRLTTEPRR